MLIPETQGTLILPEWDRAVYASSLKVGLALRIIICIKSQD